MGWKHDPQLGWMMDDKEFAAEAKRFYQQMPEKDFRRLYECKWPAPEDQVKPNTCGSCRFFEPPKDDPDWRYRTRERRGDYSPGEGWCGNRRATLGAAGIRTGRDSGCKQFTPLADA